VSESKKKLLDKISAREARVGVIGLGYVGLPLLVEFARGGFDSLGFEVDAKKADAINQGESYIPDVPTTQVAEMVEARRLGATTDFARLKDQDVIIICVPTPLRKTKDPDVSYILAASEKIQDCLRPGQLIILESTTYPGTTDEVLKPMFDATGLKLDEDYFLAFSPERVDPGNENFNTKNITKVVGGVTETSAEVAASVYGAIVDKVHPVSSARVAEACKLLENTFRAVNIGLVNELARLCDTLGIDTWEVIAAAATKPFGFMPFYPGPGIGGHCLVGNEAVVIRLADDSRKRLTLFATLFDKFWDDPQTKKLQVDGADIIPEPRLEALSLNTKTNLPEWRPVSYLFRRLYQGNLVTITTSDNRRLTATEMHPMLIVDADGRVRQVLAKDIALGDRLPIHCSPAPEIGGREDHIASEKLDLLPLLPAEIVAKTRVRIVGGSWRTYRDALKKHLGAEPVQEFIRQDYIPLDAYLELEQKEEIRIPHESLRLHNGRGPSATSFPAVVTITPELTRLIGYYLAEGCVTRENGRDRVRFSFNRAETEFISDVRSILEMELGVKTSLIHSRIDQVTHIRVASPLFGWLLREALDSGCSSREMRIPDCLFNSSQAHQVETLKGLFRGDGDVYVKVGEQNYRKNGRDYVAHNASAEVGFFSSSTELFQQTIHLLQDFGFTPTFKRTKPHLQLKGYEQLLRMRDWLGLKGARLKNYFAESRRANASRTFKSVGSLITTPVKSVEMTRTDRPTYVYSIEVEETHTFVTSYGVYVHNCIPLDPHYLSWKARMHGFEARFISLAEEVNSRMPDHVVDLVTRGLNNHRKPVNGSKVLILGVAYKRDIDDMRESPALGIIEKLQSLGADAQYHDPYVEEIHLEGNGRRLRGIGLSSETVSEADCVVIVTDHRKINYAWLTEHAKLVVDTRNATRGLSDFEEKIIRL
jgi:UDP-N-acetyl-D-mannosaminuronate dehydrogenase/intein/homing endonuclease